MPVYPSNPLAGLAIEQNDALSWMPEWLRAAIGEGRQTQIWNPDNPIGTSSLRPPQYVTAAPAPAPPSDRPVNDLMERIHYGTGTPRGFADLPGYFVGGAANTLLAGPAQMENVLTGVPVDPQQVTAGMLALSMPTWLERPQPGVLIANRRPRYGPLPEAPTYLELLAAERSGNALRPPEFVPNRALPNALNGEILAEAAPPPLRVAPDQLSNPRAVRGGNQPPMPGEANTVSTRVPDAVGTLIDPHTTAGLQSGIDAMRAAPQAFGRNMERLKNPTMFPDLKVDDLTDPHEISEAAINHMRDNLVFLHDEMVRQHGQDLVDRAGRWYDGAHAISNRMANDYGYTPAQTAAMLANLSPQKNWYENKDLGERLLDTVKNQQGTRITPEMQAWSERYIAEQINEANKAERRADTDRKRQNVANKRADIEDFRTKFAQLQQSGLTLGEIGNATPEARELRAIFVRAYDEGHNPRSFPVVTPEGGTGATVMTGQGVPRDISWGSFNEIEKALAALDSADLADISRTLGGRHKVRNFHNNIAAPMSPGGHYTADTHAIAASHMLPYGAASPVVDLGLGGGSSSNATGAMGTYGLYHEAGRRAADIVNARTPGAGHNSEPGSRGNMLPRQMQSITWEVARALFPDTAKRDNAFIAQARAIWQGYKDGLYSADEARRMMMHHAAPDGLPVPPWHNPIPRGPETR